MYAPPGQLLLFLWGSWGIIGSWISTIPYSTWESIRLRSHLLLCLKHRSVLVVRSHVDGRSLFQFDVRCRGSGLLRRGRQLGKWLLLFRFGRMTFRKFLGKFVLLYVMKTLQSDLIQKIIVLADIASYQTLYLFVGAGRRLYTDIAQNTYLLASSEFSKDMIFLMQVFWYEPAPVKNPPRKVIPKKKLEYRFTKGGTRPRNNHVCVCHSCG